MTDTGTQPGRTARPQARNGSGWYRIQARADGPAQIYVYDEIGYGGITAQDFIRDLDAINGPVEIKINSPGGSPFEAYAIFNALTSRSGVTTVVDSLAASAASVIAMAGEQRLMAKYAQLMVHDAWSISDGNAADLRHMADRLETASGQIAGIYADTAGGTPEQWREAMRAETWYTPEQALAAGLITGIIPAGRAVPAPATVGATAGGTVRASVPPAAPRAAAGAVPLGDDGWVQDPDGTVRYDPDGDGDDDSTPEGDTDNSHWDAEGNPLGPIPPCPDMPGMPPAARGTAAVHGATTARHEPITGTHSHPHPAYGSQGGDAVHSHMHEHAGDANHQHAHAQVTPGGDGSQDASHTGGPRNSAIGVHHTATVDQPFDGPAFETYIQGTPAEIERKMRAYAAWVDPDGDPGTKAAYKLGHHLVSPGGTVGAADMPGVRVGLAALGGARGGVNIPEADKAGVTAHLQAHLDDWHKKQGDQGSGSDSAAALPQAHGGTSSSAPESAPGGTAAGTSRSADSAGQGTTGPRQHPGSHVQERKTVTTTMSIEDRAARRGEIEARLTAIGAEHGDAEFPEEAQTEWDTLSAELDEHEQVLARHEQGVAARRQRLAAIAARQQGEGVNGEEAGYTAPAGGETTAVNGNGHGLAHGGIQARHTSPALHPGRTDASIYDLDAVRRTATSPEDAARRYRDNALRAIERGTFPGSLDREQAQGSVERLLARADDEHATLAQRIMAAGSDVYMRAWSKWVARLGAESLSSEERGALKRIRASLAVGVGADGGFAVPIQLDPTVLLVSDGAISPLRQISKVVQIVGKEYDLVTSTGVTVTRSAEASAMADNSPALVQPTIKAERLTGFIPFSVEIEQDWGALQSEMMMMLADAKDVEEASAFTIGNGVGANAGGVVTTLAAGSNVAGTGGAGALAAGDLDALEDAAAPRFRARSVWMASKTIYNAYRALLAAQASSAGDDWARPSAGQPATLRGYNAHENSAMVTTHATGDKVILFGDFGRGFLIVDRVGMQSEIAPILFDQATGRPDGRRGLVLWWRNNSRVIVDNAIRALVVA